MPQSIMIEGKAIAANVIEAILETIGYVFAKKPLAPLFELRRNGTLFEIFYDKDLYDGLMLKLFYEPDMTQIANKAFNALSTPAPVIDALNAAKNGKAVSFKINFDDDVTLYFIGGFVGHEDQWFVVTTMNNEEAEIFGYEELGWLPIKDILAVAEKLGL